MTGITAGLPCECCPNAATCAAVGKCLEPRLPAPMTGTAGQVAAPWDAGRLEAVLTSVLYQHFADRRGSFTFSAYGRDEEYELLDGEPDDGMLTFERKADGVQFHVEFWVNVSTAASWETAP